MNDTIRTGVKLKTPKSDTPRTDEVPHNVAELAMHARMLERENIELRKALNMACEDRDYFYGLAEKLTKGRELEPPDLTEPRA